MQRKEKKKKDFRCAPSSKPRRYQSFFWERLAQHDRNNLPPTGLQSRTKLQYLIATEIRLSAHLSPFKSPSIKKGGGNCSRREEARAAPRLGLALEESRAGTGQHMSCAQLVASIHAQKSTGHGDVLSPSLHGSLSTPPFLYRSQDKKWTMLRTALQILKVAKKTIEMPFYSSRVMLSSTP